MKRTLSTTEKTILKKKTNNFKIVTSFLIVVSIFAINFFTNIYFIAPILIISVTISAILYFNTIKYKSERESGPEISYRKNCNSTLCEKSVIYNNYLKFFDFMRNTYSHKDRACFESFLAGQKEYFNSFIEIEKDFNSKHPEVKTDFFEIVKLYPSVPEGIIGETF